MRIAITDSEYGDVDIERGALEAAGHTLAYLDARTESELIERARSFDALIVQYAPLTDQVFRELPELRAVSRYGTGVDNIDLGAADAAGVTVCNVPRYGSTEVAVHAITMALASIRGLGEAADARRAGHWPPTGYALPEHPRDLVFGIVGLGHVGRSVLEMASVFFKAVKWYDPYFPAEAAGPEGRCLSLEELTSQVNVLSVHVPLVPETTGLIDAVAIGALREPRYVVNVARGGICVEADVSAALRSGVLRGAALDVFVAEPPSPTSEILSVPRLLATPHSAWSSPAALRSVRAIAAQNLVEFFATGASANAVRPSGGGR